MEKEKLNEAAEKTEKTELNDEQADMASGGGQRGLPTCSACGKLYSGAGVKTPSGIMCPKCAPKYMLTIL